NRNPELVKEKIDIIKREFGDKYFDGIKRKELHDLLSNTNDKKVNELFKGIINSNIEDIWKEQKEFILLKQIYVAATTYGQDNSACPQGVWSQIINSLDEIDQKFLDQFNKHLEEKIEQEKKIIEITENNIKEFSEDLAKELIKYVKENAELEDTLEEFALSIVNIEEPENITFKQQRMLAKINQVFGENIKKYLPNRKLNIMLYSNEDYESYKNTIKGLGNTKALENFVTNRNKEESLSTNLLQVDSVESIQKEYKGLVLNS
uniref:hypothetical protein n=1 Tax=Wolbachia endosymbiont of Pentidionis agamae TaxID=3110435 RepID=UPI002FD49DAF